MNNSSISYPREGILAALWLPTDSGGHLLRSGLERNLGFLKSKGINGVLALGSTGEFLQFDLEQRKRALAIVAELAAPLPVLANVSDIRPRVVAELGAHARKLGLPGIAIMPPGFYRSNQDDLLAHFLYASEHAGLPTLLYNYPELTGTRIGRETVAAFAARAPTIGIKQSGGEFGYHRELIQLAREMKFSVFSGSDTRLPEVFSLGADGCIGGLVNVVPELMVHLYNVCHQKMPGAVNPAFERLKEIGAIMDRLTFPLNVAAGVEARGMETGTPKAVVSDASNKTYREIVIELRRRFQTWGMGIATQATAGQD